jgi:hypothetical protein
MIYLEPREIYDKFIVGVAEGINIEEPCLIYSKQLILNHLKATMGKELIFDHNDAFADQDLLQLNQDNFDIALEYFEYNIAGSYLGPSTPIFLSSFQENLND